VGAAVGIDVAFLSGSALALETSAQGQEKANLGSLVTMAPITYQVDGHQYLSVIAGGALVTFGLRD
jgi:hypothetical protein